MVSVSANFPKYAVERHYFSYLAGYHEKSPSSFYPPRVIAMKVKGEVCEQFLSISLFLTSLFRKVLK